MSTTSKNIAENISNISLLSDFSSSDIDFSSNLKLTKINLINPKIGFQNINGKSEGTLKKHKFIQEKNIISVRLINFIAKLIKLFSSMKPSSGKSVYTHEDFHTCKFTKLSSTSSSASKKKTKSYVYK